MSKRILAVDDQEDNRRILRDLLTSAGYEVIEATTGEDAVAAAETQVPDLILMDIQLPGIDGYEATRRIKADPALRHIPIIAVTSYALSGDDQKARAAGCDDYVTKPFSPAELTARVRALQRRLAGDGSGGVRSFGRLSIDPQAREVLLDGAPVELTRTEFDLLAALSGSPRLAFSRAQLIEAVWGAAWFGNDHLIDVHISNLRRKLGDARFVTTVRGVGYRMGADS
jgi:DNA-binding response OmpR family regulator